MSRFLDEQKANPGILEKVEVSDRPFPYFVSEQALPEETCAALLKWFDEGAPWRYVKHSFYEQCELDFFELPTPPAVACLLEPDYLSRVRRRVESLFNVRLMDRMTISAHRLFPGQGIGIHTDSMRPANGENVDMHENAKNGLETHRVVIQLSRGYRDSNGGHLLFFNSENPADIHRIFRPVHNTAVGFALTPISYHAVSELKAGLRDTLIYSFWEQLTDVAPSAIDQRYLVGDSKKYRFFHSKGGQSE